MTDFIVLGGGIAGVSAAAFLAPHGSVVLLEAEPTLAYHTTGRSAAMKVENYGSMGSRTLVKAATPFLEDPPAGSVDAPLLSHRPVLWVAANGEEESLQRIAVAGGGSSRVLTPRDVIEHMPVMDDSWLSGGLIEPSGADIDVASLHQAFVRIARGAGAELRTGAAVEAIARSGGMWNVVTPAGKVSAPALINATGAWGDVVAEMAGLRPIGLQPMRRTAFMVPGHQEWAELPMVVHVNEDWYFKPDGVQILCSLAEETPSEPVDAKPRMEDVALAIDRINTATTMGIKTVNSQWAGLRTFAPDRELVIGEDPSAAGFFWLVGQGGIGIQTSPAYGSLISSLVTGSQLASELVDAGVDPDRTSPSRFRERVG